MKRGAAWEARLEAWHRDYRRDRLAFVVKCNPAVKVLGAKNRDGIFRGCFEKQGPPDYAGLLDGGRAVLFDAKDCARTRWPLSDLALHQARDLEASFDRGALAFVALRFNGDGFVLPWVRLRERYWIWADGNAARGEASLDKYRVRRVGLPMTESGWLGVWGGR